MKGRNKIVLNNASMCEALTYWFKEKMIRYGEPTHVVVGVSKRNVGGYDEFEIEIEEAAAATTDKNPGGGGGGTSS